MKFWSFILVLMLVILITSADEVIIYINSSSPLASNTTSCGTVNAPCYTFDLGLDVAQERLMETHQLSITLIVSQGEQYKHTSMTNGVFNEVNGLSIIGEADNNGKILTTISCQGKVGFSFIKTSTIKISGIIFDKCGQLQNSTSYNYNKENKSFLTFYVGLYFLYCRDVNLTFVTVSSTPGTGIVFYNIGGNNVIENSAFFRNNVEDDKDIEVGGGGGGVYIEYSYCVPGEGGIECLEGKKANVVPQNISRSNFYICSSYFYANIANTSSFINDTFILPGKQYHSAFGRGGGLSVFFKGDASNNTITVDNCHFTHNQALWGAGMFVEFQDNTTNNKVFIHSSIIQTNSLYYSDVINEGTGGGGARVGFVFFNGSDVYSNNITFFNCTFEGNSAYYGGGLSFYSAKQPDVDNSNTDQLNTLKFQECHFMNNLGRIGAALDISLWHPSISGKHPRVFIDSCTFEGNNAMYQPQPGGLIGVGAVYIDSLPVMFSGNNSFNNNSGSALAVTGSYITIEQSSCVYFNNNFGRNGGAIALLGNTFIVTNKDSVLHFVNNSAQYKGGAIYYYSSGERELLSSRNCFIRYYDISVRPEDWTSKFYFEGNTVGNGQSPNSIYASTVLPCIWGGAYGSSQNDNDQHVFFWNDNWHYYYSHDTISQWYYQISTSPSRYTYVQPTYQVIPGQEVKLNVLFIDDLNNNISDQAILIAHMNNTDNATFKGTELNYNYIAHKKLELNGKPGTNVNIRLETLDPIVIQEDITIEFQQCPPGFVSTDNSTAICQCPNGTYAGYIMTCDSLSYTTKIKKATWMGEVPGYNDLLVGLSPYVSSSNNFEYVVLPQDPQNLSNFLCGATNRKGILCGDCIEGYGVAVNSEYFECVFCPEEHTYYNWVFYLLTEFLPVTLFFALVFVFSMSVTSGPLNSYIFFAQVITTAVDIDADGMIPLQNVTARHNISYVTLTNVYSIPYDIWNMNFFKPLWPKFCLSPHLNTIDVYAIGYITAIYVLILVIIFALILNLYNRGVSIVVCICRPLHKCLARFRRLSNFQPSVTGGVAVFILISYTKFVYVSLNLLTPTPLYRADGTVAYHAFYADGNIKWEKNIATAIVYIIIASCMLSTFVLLPPLVLFYPTFLRLVERLSCWRLQLGKFYPSAKIQSFMNEFHGCYKDGSNGGMDCRWFASLYFCLRIGVFAVYSGASTWYLKYILQLLFFLFAAFLFALIQPYQKAWLNRLDILMFLLLATITALGQYNLGSLWIGEGELYLWAFGIQYVLLFLPLLYCIGYYLVLIFGRTITRWTPYVKDKYQQFKNRGIQAEQIEEQDEFNTDRASLVDSTHVPNFLDYLEGSEHIENRVRLTNSHSWRPNNRDQSNRQLRPNHSSGTNETSPLVTASSQHSTTDSDADRQQTTKGSENANNRPVHPVQHPSEDYHTAHSTNSSQRGYGTIGSTLISLTPPP